MKIFVEQIMDNILLWKKKESFHESVGENIFFGHNFLFLKVNKQKFWASVSKSWINDLYVCFIKIRNWGCANFRPEKKNGRIWIDNVRKELVSRALSLRYSC